MKQAFYTLLTRIPKGKVLTYSAAAKVLGTHPRAIGTRCRINSEIDTYPCYKVVKTDGGLAGYNQWLPEKIRRLKADGVIFDWEKISSESFWTPTK